MSFETISKSYFERIEKGMDLWLPQTKERPTRLHAAMRFSMGGKRLRPTLLLASADLGRKAFADPLPAAVAVECLHTYSLVHDDLPAMDDSDLRRGQPSCHKEFDEATALLAGDALLTDAFRILGEAYTRNPELGLRLVAILGVAASSRRLIGGQMEDLLGEKRKLAPQDLDYIHRNKTAALLSASLEMGLAHCTPTEDELVHIRSAGEALGLAFQVVDDILDATSTSAELGKSVGQDEAAGKNTYVSIHGLDASRERVQELTNTAVEALSHWGGRAEYLIGLVRRLEHRVH